MEINVHNTVNLNETESQVQLSAVMVKSLKDMSNVIMVIQKIQAAQTVDGLMTEETDEVVDEVFVEMDV